VLPALGAMKAWMRRQARLAAEIDLMLPISTMMADEARVYGRPTRVVPDLVEDAAESGAAELPAAAADALAARRPGQRVALYAGRLAPNKGLDLVVDAARARPDWLFLVAGEDARGDYRARLEARAAGLDNVGFLGWVPNVAMPALYDAADVVLLPFLRAEPLSRGMVEALSRGRALAATAHGGPLDAVEDGRNGVLFEPTVEGLAGALDRLAGADLDEMGARSREIYEERFSPERVVAAHLDAYSSLVSGAGGRRG
jgi:glycosyltransferase involved in cell wall biosynthesis